MLFWIIAAVLTAAVAAVLLAPLMRRSGQASAAREGEAAVYRDQLKELERDLAEGLIGPQEAEYARAEIGRRLLAVSAAAPKEGKTAPGGILRIVSQAAVVTVLPATGLCLYLLTGNPGAPDQPLQARLENPGDNIALLVAKAERHLAEDPNDGRGWDILAPIYFRSLRLGDAELAYRNAIRLLGTSPERLVGLGETLVAGNQGIVTEDARFAFEGAIRLDAQNPRARFYLALALEQSGRHAEAKAAFEALRKDAPPDAPWLGVVDEHIARNAGESPAQGQAPEAAAPGPGAEEVEAAARMSGADRQEMIRGMVEGLDAKLREDPQNFEGWKRLLRSYAVLREEDKAIAALKDGLAAFPADGEEGRQLIALARELGLAVEGELK